MNEQILYGLIFGLEEAISLQVRILSRHEIREPEALHDGKCLLEAADWVLEQKLPKYVNLPYFKKGVEALRELVK